MCCVWPMALRPSSASCALPVGQEKALVTLCGGLKITPRHPVRIGGVWSAARDVPGAASVPNHAKYVCNLVLDSGHVLLVDGMECATWGHGIVGYGISRPFFGTQRVLNNLALLEGWARGAVWVQGSVKDES